MTNTKKSLLILGVIVILGIVYAVVKYNHQNIAGAVNPAGTSNTTLRTCTLALNLATTTEASCSNNDGVDRVVTSVDLWYTGLTTMNSNNPAAIQSFIVQAGTSTDAYLPGSTNSFVLNTAIATGSPQYYFASSTPGVTSSGTALAPTGGYARVWPTGTNFNLFANATSSTVTGIIRVNYTE